MAENVNRKKQKYQQDQELQSRIQSDLAIGYTMR